MATSGSQVFQTTLKSTGDSNRPDLAGDLRGGREPPDPREPEIPSTREQWTWTESIRSSAAMPFEVVLLDTAQPPIYQQVAQKAAQPRERASQPARRRSPPRRQATNRIPAAGPRWDLT